MMNLFFRMLWLLILFLVWNVSSAMAAVTWQPDVSIDTVQTPVDAVVSDDGERIYILTQSGDILIYTAGGKLEDSLHVGAGVDFIAAGPSDGQLLVGSGGSKTLQTITIEDIYEIGTANAPFEGAADAPVVIAVFMDYQCPYCVRLRSTLEEVLELNEGLVKIAYKQYPLKSHKAAQSAAAAALVAFDAGKFLEMHTLMEEEYASLDDEKILEIAVSLGFDREAFKEKMADAAVQNRIEQDKKDGKQVGVTGIPTVFINGRRLKKRSLENFQEIIEQTLERR